MDPKQQNAQPTTPENPTQQPVPSEQPKQPNPAPAATPTSNAAPTPPPAASPTTQTPAPVADSASSSQTPPPSAGTPPPPPQNTEKEEKRVSLRTVLLIVVLAILAAVLLFIALKPAQKAVVKHIPAPTPTPSQAHSTLSLVLADTTATPSGTGVTTKSVNVVLTTQSNKVSGVQFEIAYDPTVLTNVTVKPGDFFTNPLVLLNQVDTNNGKINYAIGIQPTAAQISGTGTAAVISYTLLPTASASQTTLKFLPKTQVVQQGITGSVLEHSFDLSIPVAGLTPAVNSGNSGLPTATQQ